MKHTFQRALFVAAALSPFFSPAATAAPVARLSVDVDKPGAPISPMLYGIFFEEINRAGDGGIYAEMVQNRSFEDFDFPLGWTLMQSPGATGRITLDKSTPLNPQSPTSLRLDIGAGGRVGVASYGFKGVPQLPLNRPQEWLPKFEKGVGGIGVQSGKRYDLSFYARAAQGFSGPLTATLETSTGRVLATQTVRGLTTGWKKLSVSLRASASEPDARLVISAATPGTVWLDVVSLFPRETWKGRSNGLRPDLMEKIVAMKPAFVRFPGGCYVEGDTIENRFRWKETIGDIAARPGHWNLWGYRSNDGLGYHEYLQMCEDLASEPLFVINVGMSHLNGRLNAYAVPMDQMGPYVQDALDAIEYANGPVTSKWGALRAKNGHPKPFNLKLLQIGNENGGPLYNERYALFHDAVKAKYPDVQLVACDWGGVPRNRPLDIIDPHLYSNPKTMMAQATRFDSADRNGPKIYFGEYAVTTQAGTGNLQAALAEAAFMTGMERNGDIVKMSSYAPLLSDIRWKAWNPNAIVFDQARVYGTPSYYVQALFGANRGDINLPLQVQQPQVEIEPIKGLAGVGTWNTQAEFRNIKITKNGQETFSGANVANLGGWKPSNGDWTLENGVLKQSGSQTNTRTLFGDLGTGDYTLSLQARKLGGAEGFLISFGLPDSTTVSWWNIGGWGNTMHGLEAPGIELKQVPGRIETGRWYDIRIELKGTTVNCYLDNQLVQSATRVNTQALYAVAGRDNKSGETILKVVNAAETPIEAAIDLRGARGVAAGGRALVLAGNSPDAENSFAAPAQVAPREEKLGAAPATFSRVFPARSVTILRLKAAR
ncbi:MAG TPA: alpha-L-arabinofuranosidase C-terminal domain-containing protein [Abditibacterium sp.]|jgi:alpha-L-arabinofuranosidase